MMKYASILLMAYALSDMAVGLARNTGYPIADILVVMLAGYLFFRSRFSRGIGQDLMVVAAAFLILLFSSAL
jgi:hypothetical protein